VIPDRKSSPVTGGDFFVTYNKTHKSGGTTGAVFGARDQIISQDVNYTWFLLSSCLESLTISAKNPTVIIISPKSIDAKTKSFIF